MVRLEKFYNETVRTNMMKKFSYKNPLSVPRLEKIVMNMCIKEATQDTKKLDSAFNDMKNISGQRPTYTFANIVLPVLSPMNDNIASPATKNHLTDIDPEPSPLPNRNISGGGPKSSLSLKKPIE